MNNIDIAGFSTTDVASADLPATDPATTDPAAYPTDGALVTIVDGDVQRRGWITVERTALNIVGETAWVAVKPVDPGAVWTGRVARDAITVEKDVAPEWWNSEVSELMQYVIGAAHARSSLVEDAHRWADENSLCGVFDHFMREHEMPPRRREYTAPTTVSLTLTLSVPVVARYGEDAQTLLDHELVERAVRQRFGGLRRHGLAVGDFTVGELEESAS